MYIIIKTPQNIIEGKFIAFVTVKNEDFVIFSSNSNRGNIYKIPFHQYEYFFINESTKNKGGTKGTKGIIDNYLLLEQLGQGASAFVYKALDLNNEQNVVAYKKINEKNLVYTLFKNEADIFLRLPGKNKNVIEYLGASYTPSGGKICGIALEYLPLGDVYAFMKKLTPSDNDIGNEPKGYLKPLSKFLTKHFSHELFQGLQYLHSHNIVHRDIKAANLLMKNEHNKLIIKISDFGFATALTPGQRLHDKIGTPNFMAPEIFQFNYNHSIDIWAAGVCLFLFAYGFHPFEDENLTLNGTRNNILGLHYTFPTNLTAMSSPQMKAYSNMNDLLNRIFMYEKYRISITEILNHPYFPK